MQAHDAARTRAQVLQTCTATKFAIPCFVRTKLNEFADVAASPASSYSRATIRRAREITLAVNGNWMCNRDYVATSIMSNGEEALEREQFTESE